jgi:hypothetical protein
MTASPRTFHSGLVSHRGSALMLPLALDSILFFNESQRKPQKQTRELPLHSCEEVERSVQELRGNVMKASAHLTQRADGCG